MAMVEDDDRMNEEEELQKIKDYLAIFNRKCERIRRNEANGRGSMRHYDDYNEPEKQLKDSYKRVHVINYRRGRDMNHPDTWVIYMENQDREIVRLTYNQMLIECPNRVAFWVDADHGYDQVTRRSVTGILIMIDGMVWKTYSKRQKTVETSTYGSELVAARIAVDLVIETRYALRMMGLEVDGPALMLGDNRSVVLNTTVPSSMLKKKHCAINYHRVREAIAAGIVKFVHIPSFKNIADCLTKPLAGNVTYRLIKPVMFANPGETLWPGDNIDDQGNEIIPS